MPKNTPKPPDWELVLSAAARVQGMFPEAVLVGETAAALYAGHRVSHDADLTLDNLRGRFDEVLAQLESVSGWKTARARLPVLILGSLDGIETGVRQLIRTTPLETTTINYKRVELKVPTEEEMLRIKAALILKRNATRDYVDFAALSERLGSVRAGGALKRFDALYPQESGQSALQQLLAQLSSAVPFDLKSTDLSAYRRLDKRWSDFETIREFLSGMAVDIFDEVLGAGPESPDASPKP